MPTSWSPTSSHSSGSSNAPFYPLNLFGVVDIQTFIGTGGTWTKPSSGTDALIIVFGAGGGGGSGAIGSASIYGGAGGSNGAGAMIQLPLAALGSSVTVQAGTGGAGGVGVSGATGNAGAAGSASSIFDTSNNIVVCPAGQGGGFGGTVASTGGTAAQVATFSIPSGYQANTAAVWGRSAGANGSITTAVAGNTPAGGAGGGITSAPTGLAGGGSTAAAAPGATLSYNATANTTNPGNDGPLASGLSGLLAMLIPHFTMAGGGGGAGNNGTGAGAGGNGRFGGGGGGSGSATAGTTGAGGNGGKGRVVVLVA